MNDVSLASDGFLEGLYVLDDTYTAKLYVDSFLSATWSERYDSPGDFTLTIPMIEEYIKGIRINDYVRIRESREYMIVETSTLETDVEDGDKIVFEGRTLSSILSRRIVWDEYKRTGEYNLQNGIYELLLQNVISPSNSKRAIPKFTFKHSTDPNITGLTAVFEIDAGDNLLEVIEDKCQEKKVGFRVLPKGDGGFEFELYWGTDRSKDQEVVPMVVFSDSYENLLDSNYVQSEREYVSNALVTGKMKMTDEESGKEYTVTLRGEVYRKTERVGLARREMFVDAGEVSYEGELVQKAKEEMSQKTVTEMFGGDIDIYHQFEFGQDYFLGDIVQVSNKYGFSGRCRITEILMSRDAGGPVLTPSFAVVDKNNEEVSG